VEVGRTGGKICISEGIARSGRHGGLRDSLGGVVCASRGEGATGGLVDGQREFGTATGMAWSGIERHLGLIWEEELWSDLCCL